MNLKQAKAALALGLKVRAIHWDNTKWYAFNQDGETFVYINERCTHEPLYLDSEGFKDTEWEIINELQSSEDHATDNG